MASQKHHHHSSSSQPHQQQSKSRHHHERYREEDDDHDDSYPKRDRDRNYSDSHHHHRTLHNQREDDRKSTRGDRNGSKYDDKRRNNNRSDHNDGYDDHREKKSHPRTHDSSDRHDDKYSRDSKHDRYDDDYSRTRHGESDKHDHKSNHSSSSSRRHGRDYDYVYDYVYDYDCDDERKSSSKSSKKDHKKDHSKRDHHDHHHESKSSRSGKKSSHLKAQLIGERDHIDELTTEEIALKLSHADPKKIDHSSFLVKYNPTFLNAVESAKSNFYTPQERSRLQKEAQNEAKMLLFLMSPEERDEAMGVDPKQRLREEDEGKKNDKKNTLSKFELDAMNDAVKRHPNYFSTELLQTVGGGSIFKGQTATTYSGIPGQGATNQLPIDFTNLTTSLDVQSVSLQQQQEHLKKLRDLEKNEQLTMSSQRKLMTTAISQQHQGANRISLIASRYQEPADGVVPSQFKLSPEFPKMQQWYLYLYDRSRDLYTGVNITMPMTSLTDGGNHNTDSLNTKQEGRGENSIKSESGNHIPQAIALGMGISPIPESKPIVLTLSKKSCYKIGSNDIVGDIILPPTPTMPKPTITTTPQLTTQCVSNPQLQDQVKSATLSTQTNIDSIWDTIIQHNNSIDPLHCFLQFRLKKKFLTDDKGAKREVAIPSPYLYIPNNATTTAPLDSSTPSNQNGSECFFRQTSAKSLTGFEKQPIPTNRFVEICDHDVILFGKSFYEMVFLVIDEPNPMAQSDRRLLLD